MNPLSMSPRTQAIQGCVNRLNEGDESAKEELLKVAGERLIVLTRKMKRGYHKVGRWEQTDDVNQGALIRLHKALAVTKINDAQHFLRLAAKQIRRELIDLARKHQGAEGLAANYMSDAGAINVQTSQAHLAFDRAELTNDPAAICEWGEFHELIEQLPDEQRSVVDLVLYHGMTQAEVAEVPLDRNLIGETPLVRGTSCALRQDGRANAGRMNSAKCISLGSQDRKSLENAMLVQTRFIQLAARSQPVKSSLFRLSDRCMMAKWGSSFRLSFRR